FEAGCYGDAFDLFVAYDHRGNRNEAWKELCQEQERVAASSRPMFVESPSFDAEIDDLVDADWQPTDAGLSAEEWEAYAAQMAGGEIADLTPEGEEDPTPGPDEPAFKVVYTEGGRSVVPVDLWRKHRAPEIPSGLLPSVIEEFAFRHGDVMGADPAGLAMAALAVCAAAITDDIQVQVKRNDPTWRESARLWVALVGPPSVKKTPIMNAALRPLRKIDSNLMRSFMASLRDYESLDAKAKKAATKP